MSIHCLHERHPEGPGTREDALSQHDVTTRLVHYHWATLSIFYVENMGTVLKETERMRGRMMERMNDKLGSLN